MHPLDTWWLWHFEQFYLSGKRVDAGRGGVRSAKSDSTCRPVIAELLFTDRRIEPGPPAVYAVMAHQKGEANQRFDTMSNILTACGLQNLTGKRNADSVDGFVQAGGGSQPLMISVYDSQAHPIELRVATASVAGAIGFTGIGAFCDEVDKWGKEKGANPAKMVFDLLLSRFATQPAALVHMFSASYIPGSFHAATIKEGDTPLQRIARIGSRGAEIDTRMRRELAATRGLSDPRMWEPSNPLSPNIPSWVTNPVAPIDDSFDLTRCVVDKLLALYGGGEASSGKGRGGFDGLAAANAELSEQRGGIAGDTIDGMAARKSSGL